MVRRILTTSLVTLAIIASAQPPAHYYDTAQGKAGSELRDALDAIIRNHHVIPYASGSFDTSDALRVLDANPFDITSVIEIYNGSNALANTFGLTTGWNREHQWCDSYGLDGIEPAYSDLYKLRAVDANVNSSCGNKFYDTSDTNSPGYKFPAHAEAPLCSTDSDSWEPPLYDRGNIARSLFYMATRYIGDAANEPALILTDDVALITSANSYMGKLSTLLGWNTDDPVNAAEQLLNDLVYSLYQTNRNPSVNHPEWVNLIVSPPCTKMRHCSKSQCSRVALRSTGWQRINPAILKPLPTLRAVEFQLPAFRFSQMRHFAWC